MDSIGIFLVLKENNALDKLLEAVSPWAGEIFLSVNSEDISENRALQMKKALEYISGEKIDEDDLRFFSSAFFEDVPNAFHCAAMGDRFYKKEKWRQAIFWYESAVRLDNDEGSKLCLKLAQCFGRLGEWERAISQIRIAAALDNEKWHKKYNDAH